MALSVVIFICVCLLYSRPRNRLVESALFRTPVTKDSKDLLRANFYDDDVRRLEKNRKDPVESGSLTLLTNELQPATPTGKPRIRPIQSSDAKRGLFHEVECAGFRIRTAFPDNVCRTKRGNFLYCDEFFESHTGDLMIVGRCFTNVTSAFESSDSRKLGVCQASRLSTTKELVPFSSVIQKCVVVPYGVADHLESERDISEYHPERWPDWFIATFIV